MTSLAASPLLVGAVTTLIIVVAVFLAYNANTGLPFVPVYRVSVEIPNAARLARNNEVRIGGHRVGVVETVEVAPGEGDPAATASDREAGRPLPPVGARLLLKLDRDVEPLPQDSIFRLRYRSTFGLKYLEIVRGAGEPAPEGFVFDGTDDGGVCKLPANLETFSREIPAPARNGCFQPQTEFDEIANALDAEARENLRVTLEGVGDAFAARGGSLSLAIEELRPVLDDLAPVSRTLSDPGTRLERFIVALRRTSGALAPVSGELANLFGDAAVALEAASRDPEALKATISEGVPLLERGIPAVRRARPLLADTAELFRRLDPGARELPVAVPVLNEAIRVGTPVLDRTPPVAAELRAALAELRRTIDDPATKVTLQRLRRALDRALPLAAHLVPAQTVCNYWNYWFTFVPEHLSEPSNVGFTQRNTIIAVPPGPGPVSIGGVSITPPSYARVPLAGYSGEATDGITGPLSSHGPGVFAPHEIPIGHAPIDAPHGQLSRDYPDCLAGQVGYPLGRLPVKGQRPADPQIGVGDYRGSLGRTTLFFNARGERDLRDTHVPSRQPTTWGLER